MYFNQVTVNGCNRGEMDLVSAATCVSEAVFEEVERNPLPLTEAEIEEQYREYLKDLYPSREAANADLRKLQLNQDGDPAYWTRPDVAEIFDNAQHYLALSEPDEK